MKDDARSAAQLLGARGGKAKAANMSKAARSDMAAQMNDARMSKLTPERRSEIARAAALARWAAAGGRAGKGKTRRRQAAPEEAKLAKS